MNDKGMRKFTLIWLGQMVSLFGTATTRFALLTWAYEQTGQATSLALLGFFSYSLYILLSPMAGVIVDRLDRRLVLIVSDLGAGTMTAILLLLYSSGQLQVWHLYLAEALTGAFEAFQLPAYAAATTMLLPKEHYGRASGMRSLSYSASQVVAPAFAGIALNAIGLGGIMLIDVATFFAGIAPLLFITIPRPVAPAQIAGQPRSSLWTEMLAGFGYIRARGGLMGLLFIYSGINLAAALTYFAVLAPLVLARTGGDTVALGSVQAALGAGGILGGIVMSVWGGPKRRIHGILALGAVSFLVGDFLTAVGRSVPVWMFAEFFATFFVPFIVGADRSIWQSKVEPAMQGRVFAIQNLLQQASLPIGYLVAGPLADQVFEPAMREGGSLAGIFGGLLGTGPGAGMALMFICTSIFGCVVCLSGYLFPSVRNIEDDLPDHDVVPDESDAAYGTGAA